MCRLGLVGYGYWGAILARNLARVVGGPAFICDHSPDRLAAGHAAFPDSYATADWRDALAQPVDGIVIAAPSDRHFSMPAEALMAGKHVFIEKPLALSTNHAETLLEMSSRLGLTLLVDHTYLFSPAVRTAARLIAHGAIGRATLFTPERFNAGGIRHDAPLGPGRPRPRDPRLLVSSHSRFCFCQLRFRQPRRRFAPSIFHRTRSPHFR